MTTPKLPPRHPNPAILAERRRQIQDIADQSPEGVLMHCFVCGDAIGP